MVCLRTNLLIFTFLILLFGTHFLFACVDFTDNTTWGSVVTQDSNGDYHVWANLTLCPTDQLIEGHRIFIETNNTVIDFNGGRLTGTDTWTYTYDGDVFMLINKNNITFLNTSIYKLGGRIIINISNSSNINVTASSLEWIYDLMYVAPNSFAKNITIHDIVDEEYTGGPRNVHDIMSFFVAGNGATVYNFTMYNVNPGYNKGYLLSFHRAYNIHVYNVTQYRGSFFYIYDNVGTGNCSSNITLENITIRNAVGAFMYAITVGDLYISNVILRNIFINASTASHNINTIQVYHLQNTTFENITILSSEKYNHASYGTALYMMYSKDTLVKDVYVSGAITGLYFGYGRGNDTLQNITLANALVGLSLAGADYRQGGTTIQDVRIYNTSYAIQFANVNYAETTFVARDIYVDNTTTLFYKLYNSREDYHFYNVHVNNLNGPIVAAWNADGLTVDGLYINNAVEPLFIMNNSNNIHLSNVVINHVRPRYYYALSDSQVHKLGIELEGYAKYPITYEIYYDSLASTPITNRYSPYTVFRGYDTFEESSLNTSIWTLSQGSYTMENGCLVTDGTFKLVQVGDRLWPQDAKDAGVWTWGAFNASADKIHLFWQTPIVAVMSHPTDTQIQVYNKVATIWDHPYFNSTSESAFYSFWTTYGYVNADNAWKESISLYNNSQYLGTYTTSLSYWWLTRFPYLTWYIEGSSQKICGMAWGRMLPYSNYTLSPEIYAPVEIDGTTYNRRRDLKVNILTGIWLDSKEQFVHQGTIMLNQSYFGGNLFIIPKYHSYLWNSSLYLTNYDEYAGFSGWYLNNSQLVVYGGSINYTPIGNKSHFTLSDSELDLEDAYLAYGNFAEEDSNSAIYISGSYLNSLNLGQLPYIEITNTTMGNITHAVILGGKFETNLLINSSDINLGVTSKNIDIQGGQNVLEIEGSGFSNINASNVSGYVIKWINSVGKVVSQVYINSSEYGVFIENVSNSTIENADMQNCEYALYVYNSTRTEYKYIHATHNTYGLFFNASTLNSLDHDYLCSNTEVGLYFTADSHDNQGSDNSGNMTDKDTNTYVYISTSTCTEDYYVNVYVVGNITIPKQDSIIGFEKFNAIFEVQDNYDTNCTLYNCSVEHGYSTDAYFTRFTANTFILNICPGENIFKIPVYTLYDFEDSFGNYHKEIPLRQFLYITCKNSNTMQAAEANVNFYAVKPTTATMVMIVLSVVSMILAFLFVWYGDLGTLVSLIALVILIATVFIGASDGSVNAEYIKETLMFVVVLDVLAFTLSLVKYSFENAKEAKEGL